MSISSEEQTQNTIDLLYEEYNNEKKRQRFNSSWTRIIIITILTYIILSIYMDFIHIKDPYYNAVIPAIGYYLSTLSLSFIRKIWIEWDDWKVKNESILEISSQV